MAACTAMMPIKSRASFKIFPNELEIERDLSFGLGILRSLEAIFYTTSLLYFGIANYSTG